LWSNGDTLASSLYFEGGFESVMVVDSNNCSATDTFFIFQNPEINPELQLISPVICNGDASGSIAAIITGGTSPYSFEWSNGDTISLIEGLQAATYQLFVTDSFTCETDALLTLEEPTPLQLGLDAVSQPACYSNSDGYIEIQVSGGWGNYVFSWSDGSDEGDLYGIPAGSYQIDVIDKEGCEAELSIFLAEPNALTVNVVSVDPVSGNDGSLSVSVSGGTPPYSYDWNTGATSNYIDGLLAGVYTCDIQDSKGCGISFTDTLGTLTDIDLGLNDISDFICWPNPFSSRLQFSVDSKYQDIRAEIINLEGKRLFTQYLVQSDGGVYTLYTGSALISGTYILIISAGREILGRQLIRHQ
jgi:hypothetical protein